VNTPSKIRWTSAAIIAANLHDLSPEERRAVEARSAASANGKILILAVDVLAIVRGRRVEVVA